MFSKHIAAALIALAPLSSAVYGQSQSPPAPPAEVAKMVYRGEWRASKLIGVSVYNLQKEKIGDINDFLVSPAGGVVGYVVGVGGFLGLGEHDVLMRYGEVSFVGGRDTQPASPMGSTAPSRTSDAKWYPDHAIVNATKDQLKDLPEFKYSNYN